MRLTIAYTNRGSKTGLELFKALKDSGRFTWVKRVNSGHFDANTDVLIRWGSAVDFNTKVGCLQLNGREAVLNAADKTRMMTLLMGNDKVRNPNVIIRPYGKDISSFKDKLGSFYVRGSNGSVRHDTILKSDDLYISKPIDRIHEYRVQVFNNQIVGIYEKMPEDINQKLMKGYNCHFRKLDASVCSCKEQGQLMAIEAVKAMGLLSGGVDVIKDKYNRYFINEVNSAFGLNSLNVVKFKDLFINYINHV